MPNESKAKKRRRKKHGCHDNESDIRRKIIRERIEDHKEYIKVEKK